MAKGALHQKLLMQKGLAPKIGSDAKIGLAPKMPSDAKIGHQKSLMQK